MRLSFLRQVTVLAMGICLGGAAWAEDETPALTFGFLTDTHVGSTVESCERVKKALEVFRARGVELVVHTGDVANQHDPAGYRAYSNVFATVFADASVVPRQITAVGNHDTQMNLGALTQAEAAAETLALLGVENTHTDSRTVKGYTFLTMPYNVGGEGFLSWADYEAAVSNACANTPNRPVFVVEHEPPRNTVYNSYNWGYAQSRAILNKYPQVVELSGHVHGSLRNDRFFWQGEFTVINACCLNVWQGLLDGTAATDSKISNAVLTLDVYEDRIVARRWDILDGSEIDPEHPWIVELPYDAATATWHTARRAAVEPTATFAAGDLAVSCNENLFNGFTLTFPEVPTNTMTYWLVAEAKNVQGVWTEVAHAETFSQFWKEPGERTATMSYTFDPLSFEPDTDYRFSVRCVNQYGTRGEPVYAEMRSPATFPPDVPDAFVEYVESNGQQYLDTKVIGRSGTKSDLDIDFRQELVQGVDIAALDCRKDSSDSRFFLFHTSHGLTALGYGKFLYAPSGSNDGTSYRIVHNTRYHIVSDLRAGSQTVDLDGARIYTDSNASVIDTGVPLYLFACNYGGMQYASRARCYGLKIWQTDDDGVSRLVRDFAPCVKEGRGALFDRVSGRIFEGRDRNGSVSGLATPAWRTVEPGTPDYFVEYIESSGRQILDTGVPARNGVIAEGAYAWVNGKLDLEQTFLGAVDRQPFYMVHTAHRNCWLSYDTVRAYPTNSTSANGRITYAGDRKYTFTVDFTDKDNLSLTLDGERLPLETAANAVANTAKLMLFASCVNGTPMYYSYARCYGLKLWLDGALVRDFRPCVKDGWGGLYDVVHDEILFPMGDPIPVSKTGPFASGFVSDGRTPTPVAYIESKGDDYIDLDVVGKSGVSMWADMMWVEVPGDGSFLAARKESDTRFYLYHNYQSQMLGYGGYTDYQSGVAATAGVRQIVESTLKSGEQLLKVDGSTLKSRSDSANVDTGLNLYAFACNKDGTASYGTRARCYGLKLWEDGELVRSFTPCTVPAAIGSGNNDTVALYDEVSGEVFAAGGGRNLNGPAESPTTNAAPDRFVEYIQSDGRQFIDTGVPARGGVKAEGDLLWLNDGAKEQTYLGAFEGDRCYMMHIANQKPWASYANGCGHYATNAVTGEAVFYEAMRKYHFVADFSDPANVAISLDGTNIYSQVTNVVIDTSVNLALFGVRKYRHFAFPAQARCYGLKMWMAGELVRDFRPCVKDGKGGLYDAVSGRIFFPIGADFTGVNVGPVVDDAPEARSFVEYVESDGGLWFDTGVIGRSGTKAALTFMPLWSEPIEGMNTLDKGLLGARTDVYGNTNRFFLCHAAQGALSYGYGSFGYAPAEFTIGSLATGVVHTVVSDFRAGSQTMTLDGAQVLAWNSSASVDTGLSMYLFAENVGGVAKDTSRARCYGLKIWQDGRLVRDYRPAVTRVGEPCLYDVVSQTCCFASRPFAACGPETAPLKENTLVILR